MALYPYQEHVKQLLLSGKSVILQAPTGAGKTRAALAPYIEAFFDLPPDEFPRKCIYSVPMRVLANQFAKDYTEYAASYERKFKRKLKVSIQTGDQPDDRRFEGDLIFCTIDQFLSSYLTMPYSLPNRLANLNAGAMAGSYLVFDEFHLLDPGSTLSSTLYAIKQLSRLAPVLLMTATFSASMLKNLASELSFVDFLVSPQEAHAIETREKKESPRQRSWRTNTSLLSAEAVLSLHHTRTLALCNTVQRAQTLFRELRTLIKKRENNKVQLLLLHSRFLPGDRRNTETALRQLFGKDNDRSGSVIAVATQAIEVGVDITCETLHTELAPASSLIQRAGRCARYPGEAGQIIVYPVESYMPYGREKPNNPEEEAAWVKEMKAAFIWLEAHSGEVFDFDKEQALVNAVATPRDEKVLEELSSGRHTRATDIQRVLEGERMGQDQRLLIRDADSRLVLIHANPDQLLKNPYAATGFNLQLETLSGMFKQWQEREVEVDLEWRVKWLIEDKNTGADKNESNRTEYAWRPLTDASLLAGARVIVVNPALAGYLKDEGFVADQGNTDFESRLPPDAGERTWEGNSYRLESYEDHIQLVLEAFQELVLPELRFSAPALERSAGWQPGSVLQTAWLVCLLHDVGKLSEGWQDWARAYQRQIGQPVASDFAAAHTESTWGNAMHEAAAKAIHGKHPKPNHAGEGALAVTSILASALGSPHKALIQAALTAIVRHHTPFARECGTFTLEAQASRHIQATLRFVPEELSKPINLSLLKSEVKIPPNSFPNLLVSPSDDFDWLAYTLLARALRRADQEGTKRGAAK